VQEEKLTEEYKKMFDFQENFKNQLKEVKRENIKLERKIEFKQE
jgi:hypothetical protein